MNMVELVLSSFSTGFIMTKSGLVLWVLGHVSGQQWHQILQRRRRLLAAVVIRALTVTVVNVTLAPRGQGDRDFACATLGFTQFWSLLEFTFSSVFSVFQLTFFLRLAATSPSPASSSKLPSQMSFQMPVSFPVQSSKFSSSSGS